MSMTASSASNVFRESRIMSVFPLSLNANACRAEARRSARRSFQSACLAPFDAGMRRNNELRDLHAARYREGRRAVIDENGGDFTAIIGIDRTWSIKNRTTVPQRQSGARPQLRFGAGWQGQRDSGRHRLVSTRREHNVGLDRGN